jgi:hypothetical protein
VADSAALMPMFLVLFTDSNHPMHLHHIARLQSKSVIAHPMHLHQTTNFQLKEEKNHEKRFKIEMQK